MKIQDRRLLKKLLFFISLVLILFFAHKILRKTSPLYNLFFSPKDINYEVFFGEADLMTDGFFVKKIVKCKYPGNYKLVGYIEKPTNFLQKDEPFFVCQTLVYRNSKIIHSFLSNEDVEFGFGNKKSIWIKLFEIPQDWPLDQEVTLGVKVLKADPEFHKKYGKMKIYFRKASDE